MKFPHAYRNNKDKPTLYACTNKGLIDLTNVKWPEIVLTEEDWNYLIRSCQIETTPAKEEKTTQFGNVE